MAITIPLAQWIVIQPESEIHMIWSMIVDMIVDMIKSLIVDIDPWCLNREILKNSTSQEAWSDDMPSELKVQDAKTAWLT
jgi:hypothetical protein